MYSYQKRGSKIKKIITLLVLMIVVSATSIYVYDIYINIDIGNYKKDNNSAERISAEQELVIPEKQDMMLTLEETTKCVVGISKIKNTGNTIFSGDGTQTLGLGTGIIVSENGYILTNWHVAGNKYGSCYVTIDDGTVCDGSVLWADSDLDLAIVKINKKGLPFLNLGDSDNIKLGEPVYAIGNPIGIEFQRTVTARNY
jgi:S1-C subfamily serine protease